MVARRAERSVWALLAADAERTNAETARYLNRLSDLLFILARTANPGGDILWEPGAHSGAHAQRPAAESASAPGGADSTQERKPVTVELSIASSRGPSGVVMVRTTTSDGQGEVVAAGAAPGLAPGARPAQSRSCGRTDSDSPRYQSSMSPPYQATPTDQRGDRDRPQPHGDRAETGEQEPPAQQERHDDDDERRHRAGRAGPWSRASRCRRSDRALAQAFSPAARSRDWARRAASRASGSSRAPRRG